MNISIHTAHNVAINYTSAGVFERILATIIDSAFLFGLFFIGSMIASIVNKFVDMDIVLIIFGILLSFYHLICEYAFNGRSLGKYTMRLQVVKLNGKKLTFWDCTLRWIFRLIDILISSGAVALVFIVASKRSQRLGDMSAGTTVIRHERNVTLKQMSQFDAPEEYEVVFQQAALLSDKDINIIKDVLREVHKNRNYGLLTPLAKKIKEVTGIETDMIPLDFVKTILKDYTRLANGHD